MNARVRELLALILTDAWEDVLREGWWVPLEAYLAEYKGETAKAVYNRRSNGTWQDGVHAKFIKGSGVWVNLLAVNAWAAKSGLRLVSQSGKGKTASPSASGSPSCTGTSSAANDST